MDRFNSLLKVIKVTFKMTRKASPIFPSVLFAFFFCPSFLFLSFFSLCFLFLLFPFLHFVLLLFFLLVLLFPFSFFFLYFLFFHCSFIPPSFTSLPFPSLHYPSLPLLTFSFSQPNVYVMIACISFSELLKTASKGHQRIGGHVIRIG